MHIIPQKKYIVKLMDGRTAAAWTLSTFQNLPNLAIILESNIQVMKVERGAARWCAALLLLQALAEFREKSDILHSEDQQYLNIPGRQMPTGFPVLNRPGRYVKYTRHFRLR